MEKGELADGMIVFFLKEEISVLSVDFFIFTEKFLYKVVIIPGGGLVQCLVENRLQDSYLQF